VIEQNTQQALWKSGNLPKRLLSITRRGHCPVLCSQKHPPRILTEPLPKIGKVAYFLGYHYTPPCIGEAGVPVIAPAIANAVSQLTGGKRLRQLPMLPNRVQAALRAA